MAIEITLIGPPASGKSTVASMISNMLPGRVVVEEVDGHTFVKISRNPSDQEPVTNARVWQVVPRRSMGFQTSLVPDLKIPNFGSLDALRITIAEELDLLGLT